ncbi:hypothetical protein NQ318_016295 [Aromia moschata]|uniref:Uncharacterized protein n=1 Tax=Aromia moschata TaxID=1265417 RepID=A0AAV8XG72_9CUCU|nr:hypothetical protein NQ318_016295 [Aromia moschata]
MSTYEFDPDVCRQVLQKVAEDMPSGLSDPDLDEELVRFINESVTSSIKQKIDWLWGKYGIPEKLKQLKQLEKKSKKGDAWRPTTGEVDLDPIRVAKLETLKKELRKEIAEGHLDDSVRYRFDSGP